MDNNSNIDFSTLVNNLKSGNIPDDIKNKISPEMISNFASMLNNMNSNGNSNTEDNSSTSNEQNNSNNFNIDMDMLFKMKNIFDKMNNTKDDPRANLLLSLKPYLKESRKEKVEQYVKLFSMGKIMEVFNSGNGGDNKK